MRKIRCFVAIELGDELADAAEQLIRELAPHGPGVKWVEPENMHLTLKFLGDIQETESYQIAKAVQSVADSACPFQITLAGLGAFPSLDKPRTPWIGVTEGQQSLCDLQSGLDESLAESGYPRERRQFHPHLTLGRARDRVSRQLVAALGEWQAYECGSASVDRLLLLSSELHRSGPIYTTLATCEMAGGM